MKKQQVSKLSLHRETLVALSPQELDVVNGAIWAQVGRTLVQVSRWACTTVTTVASARIVTCK